MSQKILMVPGCGARNDVLCTRTIGRCQTALERWKTGAYDIIVCSGGIYDFGQTKSAAKLMKDWLIENGVGQGSILTEEESVDSYGNASETLRVLGSISFLNITIVTDFQHCARIWIVFRAYGIRTKRISVRYKGEWKHFFKEVFHMLYTIYDPRGQRWLAQVHRNIDASRMRKGLAH